MTIFRSHYPPFSVGDWNVRVAVVRELTLCQWPTFRLLGKSTPPKADMTMEHPPFEDGFPIEHGDFLMSC